VATGVGDGTLIAGSDGGCVSVSACKTGVASGAPAFSAGPIDAMLQQQHAKKARHEASAKYFFIESP